MSRTDDDETRHRKTVRRADEEREQPVEPRGDQTTTRLGPAPAQVSPWLQLQPGDELGSYRITRELGRGGMGVVYLASRADSSFELEVAIKSITRLGRPDLARRFESERQILARLRHPNIAHVLDGGTSAEGLPYLVMEYVDGEPLDDYCGRHRLSTKARLELFLQVCDGVEHAHRNLVVHRDLKPANILVTADGHVKLLDFGIAKLLDEEGVAELSTSTRWGGNAMTPEYASPEQVRLEPITTVSDVYSLGVVLYELLTGARPHEQRERSLPQQIQAICELDPSPPSQVVEAGAHGDLESQAGPPDPARLARDLRGDLDNIVLTALRKEPAERYRSVEALAEDIRLHLAGEPVRARSPTFRYVAGRFLRRHRLAVAAAGLALLSLTIGGVVSVAQGMRASREAARATTEADRAKRMNSFLESLLTTADPVRGLSRNATLGDLVDFAAERLQRDFSSDPGARGTLRRTLAGTYLNLGLPEQARHHLDLALQEHQLAYGADHFETIETQRQLAVYEESIGDHQAALVRLGPVIAAFEAMPTAVFQLALSLDLSGTALAGLGRIDEALGALRRSIALFEQVDGAQYEIINTFNNIAVAQLGASDPASAVSTLEEGLRRAAEYSEEPFPLQARMITNLGLAWREQQNLKEAEHHLAEGATLLTTILGVDHPETLLSRIAHSQVLSELGRPEDAAAEMALVIAAAEAALPPEHYILPYARSVYAEILVGLGRGSEAEAQARAAVEARRAGLPSGHWLIASSETSLGAALLLQDRRDEAIEILEGAYRVLVEARGAEFAKALEAKVLLASARAEPEL